MDRPEGLYDFLVTIPSVAKLSHRARILLVSYQLRRMGITQCSTTELLESFTAATLPPPPNLDVRLRQMATGTKAPLVRTGRGRYSLSIFGVQEIEDFLQSQTNISPARGSLSKLVGQIADEAQKLFLAESIACVQVSARRAAVVMVWLLTIDHLQRYVLQHKLGEFNQALKNRTEPEYRSLSIMQKDDFSEIKKEIVFIDLLRAAGVITNDVRKILDSNLGFRNTCAHPTNVQIPDTKVVAAIEDLTLNVLLKYPLQHA